MCVTNRKANQGPRLGRFANRLEPPGMTPGDVVPGRLQQRVDRRRDVARQRERHAIAETAHRKGNETGGKGRIAAQLEDQALDLIPPAARHGFDQLLAEVDELLGLSAARAARVVALKQGEKGGVELLRSRAQSRREVIRGDLQRAREEEDALLRGRPLMEVPADDERGGVSTDRHAGRRSDVGHSHARLADTERLGDFACFFNQAPVRARRALEAPCAGVERQHLVEGVLAEPEEATDCARQGRRSNGVVDSGREGKLRRADRPVARGDVSFE